MQIIIKKCTENKSIFVNRLQIMTKTFYLAAICAIKKLSKDIILTIENSRIFEKRIKIHFDSNFIAINITILLLGNIGFIYYILYTFFYLF